MDFYLLLFYLLHLCMLNTFSLLTSLYGSKCLDFLFNCLTCNYCNVSCVDICWIFGVRFFGLQK